MIDKYNIPLQNKLTKRVVYHLWLDDDGYWVIDEYNQDKFRINSIDKYEF